MTVEIKDHLSTKRKFSAFADKGRTFEGSLEKLVSYRIAGRALDAGLTRWLETLPPKTTKRLALIGLIDVETTAATKPLMKAINESQKGKA